VRTGNRELDAIAAPAPEESPEMLNQVVDAAMARALHADACRDPALVAWIIMPSG
jgi:hypothetical protein